MDKGNKKKLHKRIQKPGKILSWNAAKAKLAAQGEEPVRPEPPPAPVIPPPEKLMPGADTWFWVVGIIAVTLNAGHTLLLTADESYLAGPYVNWRDAENKREAIIRDRLAVQTRVVPWDWKGERKPLAEPAVAV